MASAAPVTHSTLDDLPPVAVGEGRSPADLDRLADAGEPVVLRGLFDDWPALVAGRASRDALVTYLKAMDRGAATPVMEAPAATGGRFGYARDLREFTFSKRQRGLAETLDRIAGLDDARDAPVVAIQMLALAEALPAFVRDNPMALLPPSVGPRLWLGGRVRTQTHNDRDHNLACVVAGRRRFVLFPPDQVGNLYVGPLDNPPPLSLVDPEAPDLARFPRFAEALGAARVAHLEPGEALLMPRYWWHHVTSLDPFNAMVNYWWGDEARGLENANDCFLTALLALGERPLSERAYWRAMFDTYVFHTDGDRTDHIPDALKGVLGPLKPAQRAALKQQLKTAALRTP